MRRVLLIPSILLLALFIVCFGLSAGPFSAQANANKPIVICTIVDIKTLDVGKMSWMDDIRVAMALWEGLAAYDVKDKMQPIPAAAKSWEISPDGLVYTFHLRPDGKWSNGDPVKADDFIFAWKRVLTPNTGSDYIGLFRCIEGAEAYTEAIGKKEKPDAAKLGFKKIDDLTLQVKLKSPCTYFLDLLAMPVFFPMNENSMRPFLLAEEGAGYNPTFAQPPNLVTNGPFKLKRWRVKRDLTVEPNPHYWDRDNVHCPLLEFQPVSDGRTAMLMLQGGDLDLITYTPTDFADSLVMQHKKEGKWPELHSMPVFGSYYLIFNCKRKPFDDPRVRLALSLAVNRQEVVNVLNAGQRPLGLIVPPDSINGYTSPAGVPTDVERARKLLAEAGFPEGRGLKTIDFLFNTESTHGKVAQAVGQMWQTHLGVSINYRGLDGGGFRSARQKDHDFDVARGGWYGDYPDPTTWLDLLRSEDGNNDGKYSSKEYDELMANTDREANPEKRFALLRKAEDMLVNKEAPLIPLYQYADGYLYDENKIKGAEMNVRMMTQLKWVRRPEK